MLLISQTMKYLEMRQKNEKKPHYFIIVDWFSLVNKILGDFFYLMCSPFWSYYFTYQIVKIFLISSNRTKYINDDGYIASLLHVNNLFSLFVLWKKGNKIIRKDVFYQNFNSFFLVYLQNKLKIVMQIKNYNKILYDT